MQCMFRIAVCPEVARTAELDTTRCALTVGRVQQIAAGRTAHHLVVVTEASVSILV